MYAANETSPAAQPNETGIKVAKTTKACLSSFLGGYHDDRYQTINSMTASIRSHGIGVRTRFVKRKTNSAPHNSPRLEPATMTWYHSDRPRYRVAMAGAIAFSRYR